MQQSNNEKKQKQDQEQAKQNTNSAQQNVQNEQEDFHEGEEQHDDLQIGGVQVQDMKDVIKKKEQDNMAKKENDFNWDLMVKKDEDKGASQAQKNDKDLKRNPAGKQGDIKFGGGRPQFMKSKNFGGNKKDFPELANEGNQESQSKGYQYGANEERKAAKEEAKETPKTEEVAPVKKKYNFSGLKQSM